MCLNLQRLNGHTSSHCGVQIISLAPLQVLDGNIPVKHGALETTISRKLLERPVYLFYTCREGNKLERFNFTFNFWPLQKLIAGAMLWWTLAFRWLMFSTQTTLTRCFPCQHGSIQPSIQKICHSWTSCTIYFSLNHGVEFKAAGYLTWFCCVFLFLDSTQMEKGSFRFQEKHRMLHLRPVDMPQLSQSRSSWAAERCSPTSRFQIQCQPQGKTKIVQHILSHPTQIYEDMLCISREIHQRDQGDELWDVPPIATKAPSKPVELVWAMIEHHPCPLDRSEWTSDRNL